MYLSPLQLLLLALLAGCLASFGWAMQRFFLRPAGTNAGMRVISGFGTLSALLNVIAILTADITPGRALLASALYVCSLALFWWSIAANQKAPLSAIFSPDPPEHLVDAGPYRFMRHPFYCSYLLAWIAGLAGTAKIWLIPIVAGMLFLYIYAAQVEERKFHSGALAARYREYRSRTGLLAPNPFKMFGRR